MDEQVAKWTWNCIVIGVMTRTFYHSCSLFNDWSCHNCLLSFPFFITREQSMNLRLVKFYQRWMKPKTPVHCRNWIEWNRVKKDLFESVARNCSWMESWNAFAYNFECLLVLLKFTIFSLCPSKIKTNSFFLNTYQKIKLFKETSQRLALPN